MARLAASLPVSNCIHLKKPVYLEPDAELARLILSLDYPLAGSDACIDTDSRFSGHRHDYDKCSGAYCEWLAGLLRALSVAEALQATMLHLIAGRLVDGGLIQAQPFREPHHSASTVALVCGGPRARPGEILLAHNGVLFLDELVEFARLVLDSMRQLLETGQIVVARAYHKVQCVARSVADLKAEATISRATIAEALAYRAMLLLAQTRRCFSMASIVSAAMSMLDKR